MTISTIAWALALNLSAAVAPAVADRPANAPQGETAPGTAANESAPPAPPGPAPSPENPTEAAPGMPAATPPAAPDPKASGNDIVVTGREKSPADPLAGLNTTSYQAFNYLLQLKPGRMVKSVGRFAVNSSLGVGGLIDMAKRKPFNLPYTPNGFANTFACYGIGPGPYFFLPLVGPTTLRDLIGVGLDRAALPAVVGPPLSRPYYAIPANVIDSLNDRIDIDDQLKEIRANSADPYVATRELYLRQRKSEIAAICPKKGEAVDTALPSRPGKGRD
jgi:phospholipid-binding lipoprotein MlaA